MKKQCLLFLVLLLSSCSLCTDEKESFIHIIDRITNTEKGIASPESTEAIIDDVQAVIRSNIRETHNRYLHNVAWNGHTYFNGEGQGGDVTDWYNKEFANLKNCLGSNRRALLDLVRTATREKGLPLYLCRGIDLNIPPLENFSYIRQDFAVTPEERELLFQEGIKPTALLQTALDGSLQKSWDKAEKYYRKNYDKLKSW